MLAKILSFLAKLLWIKELGLLNGLALIVSFYVHEYGHYFMADELGLKPKIPRFIPFFGAYVKHDITYDDKKRFKVAFAGPLAGGLLGIACFYLDLFLQVKFIHQVALFSLLLNLTNLIPYAILDGGHIAKSLGFHYFRLLVIGAILFFAFSHKQYILILLGVIGLIGFFVPEEQKLKPMNTKDKELGLFAYLAFILILGVHTYLIFK